MEKKVKNLKWKPMCVSHLGCIKGCLDYLGIDVSTAWLFGATGHAFIINIHEVVCPSSPTAWHTEMLFKLGENIGYSVDGVLASKLGRDFYKKQKLAWEKTKNAIDKGLPSYGWELEIPEFYVIYGYDDKGYYFSGPGCNSGKGPKPWKDLGNTDIGIIEIYNIKKSNKENDKKTVKDAFTFALEHSQSPAKWILPEYQAGLAGYDTWIKALETGKAEGFGMAYNAAVWSECREFAVPFLIEAKERLNGTKKKIRSLFDEAIEHYSLVAGYLKRVSDAFPLDGKSSEHIKDNSRCSAAIEALKEVRKAEKEGLETLEKIVNEL